MFRGTNFRVKSQQVPGKAHDQRDKNDGRNDVPPHLIRRVLLRRIKNCHEISSVYFSREQQARDGRPACPQPG
jgi:hypothetical protein